MIATKQEKIKKFYFNGISVEIRFEQVFDREEECARVKIINDSGKPLIVQKPKEQVELPSGVYC